MLVCSGGVVVALLALSSSATFSGKRSTATRSTEDTAGGTTHALSSPAHPAGNPPRRRDLEVTFRRLGLKHGRIHLPYKRVLEPAPATAMPPVLRVSAQAPVPPIPMLGVSCGPRMVMDHPPGALCY
ncbi:exported hypothetical protein [Nitrolancea hollandica Lb]|uniref:Secreted protein n=1 Tax=Nitrolancea hollandica Lb TaxID=1129897 RepID=I4ECR6_9BACT|nr:exported hypothetical protein [Nitrolancea hollandica Lb]